MKTLVHKILRLYWRARAELTFRLNGVSPPPKLAVGGAVGLSVAAASGLKLGRNLTLLNDSRYNRAGINHAVQLVSGPGAMLTIGNDVGISGGAIYCLQQITIGNNVLLGVNCNVYDTDFHPVDHNDRRTGQPGLVAAVTIEDDVWLGANVTVLKGVTIGARSVIGAGSVVTRDIPADTFAAGSPARVIRTLTNRRAA